MPTGPETPRPVVLRAPRLLDGTGAPAVPDAALLLSGGRVAYAGPAAGLPSDAGQAPSLNFPGTTLLPGLVDVHVHLVASGGPDLAADVPRTEAERALAAVVNARRQLEAGVTLVRDLGAPGAEAVLVGRAVEAGTIAGPRVLASGPAVTMTGGHIAYIGRVTDGADAMRAAVRANLALGAGCIKVVATGGVLTMGIDPREASYTQLELEALVSEAHRLGLTVAAHAIGEGGVVAALTAGVDSIEHGMFLDDASIELFGSTGARYTPTFSAPHGILGGPSVPGWIKDRARPAADAQVASFQAAVRAGVRVVAGTDAGTPDNPHGGVAREVAFMVEAGLDTLTAVRAATGEAADLLGVPDRGVLRPGAAADVLVASGDVAADITGLQRPVAVFQDGRRVV
ncbi:MAG TPA: amidohydrolase family protein [Actinomycetota bacterium]|jgi:imidazolonepropionase-like amidohydrolase|nr:amidohydrolase family protein [Actinomycetota bacterium]